MKDIANSASRNGHSTAPVDEVLPVTQMILYGLQHVLVMYAGAVAVPLVGGIVQCTPRVLIIVVSHGAEVFA